MPREDVNALFAAPWPRLQQQFTDDLRTSVAAWQLDANNLHSGTAVRYQLRLRLDDSQLSAQTASPPGFESLTNTAVRVAVPLDANGWDLTLTGRLNGFLDVWGLGNKFIDKKIQDEPQEVKVRAMRVIAEVRSDDLSADRPQLTGIQLRPHLAVELSGFIATSLTLDSLDTVIDPNGAFQYHAKIEHLHIKAIRDAELNGTLTLTLGDTVVLKFDGSLKAGAVSVPIKVNKTMVLPQSVGELLKLISTQQDWGEGHPQEVTPIPATLSFAARAQAVEDAIREHTPYGAIFDTEYGAPLLPSAPPHHPRNYYGAGDSAIWTGHYLATQAFRYAAAKKHGNAAQQAKALARAGEVLDGFDILFAIPEKATEAVAGSAGKITGLLCRAALPDDSPIPAKTPFNAPPPDKKHNYYGPVSFSGKSWHALGRDDDPPSRDSHTGLLLGLASSYHLIDDAGLRARVTARVTAVLEFLISHGWNVPTPTGVTITKGTDGKIKTRIKTSFLFEFHQQLAFLRLGKTVNAAKFGAAYDAAARSADWAWIPLWGDCLEPIGKYYKFNLDHAALGVLLLLETDAALRAHYGRALRLLRRTLGHHRNAYFNLWWILANPAKAGEQAAGAAPGVTVAEETRFLLYEWTERTDRVPGANQALPRKETPSVVYLTNLDPQRQLGRYHQFGEPNPTILTTFPLPLNRRPGTDMDFCWQRPPFLSGLKLNTAGKIDFPGLDRGQTNQESPGIDYLLPYYMADYLGLVS